MISARISEANGRRDKRRQPAQDAEVKKMVKTAVEAQNIRPVTVPSARSGVAAQSHDITLKLAVALQTTLDVQRLIALFAEELGKVIPHDHVAYRNTEQAIEFQIQQPARHSCTYGLTLEQQPLGEISFTRRKKFSDQEIAQLEQLLGCLVYPLRNGLHYKQALDEARKDPLTGVFNRSVLETVLGREVGLARRYGNALSLIFLDIDRFKSINDTHGHAVGDQVIRGFVDQVIKNIRTTDVVGRYGGDEFVIVLTNTPIDGAMLLAERIRQSVSQLSYRAPSGRTIELSASLGVACANGDETAATLLDRADRALATAKQSGRNCVQGADA